MEDAKLAIAFLDRNDELIAIGNDRPVEWTVTVTGYDPLKVKKIRKVIDERHTLYRLIIDG